ncbi:hypothetical protein [Candidatus Harpocratesius sp.]
MSLVQGVFQYGYISGRLGIARDTKPIKEIPNALNRAEKIGKKLVKDIELNRKFPVQNLFGKMFEDFLCVHSS